MKGDYIHLSIIITFAIHSYKLHTNNKHNQRLAMTIDIEQRFFKNLNHIRKKKGLSMAQLCSIVSDDSFVVDYRSISRYGGWSKIKYKKRVSVYYLTAYCVALGVSLGEMISNDFESQDGALK